MRRALPLVVLALSLALVPSAAAQAPEPGEVVAQACALAGDAREAIPLCPREEPTAPQQPQAPAPGEAHEHGAAEPAQEIAGEAQETVGEIAQDPAGAPDRLAAFVATVLQFLRDLLSLPVAGATLLVEAASAIGAAVAGAASAVAGATASGAQAAGDAVASGASFVGGLAAQAWDAVGALFAGSDVGASSDGGLVDGSPGKAPVDAAAGLVEQVVGALPA